MDYIQHFTADIEMDNFKIVLPKWMKFLAKICGKNIGPLIAIRAYHRSNVVKNTILNIGAANGGSVLQILHLL